MKVFTAIDISGDIPKVLGTFTSITRAWNFLSREYPEMVKEPAEFHHIRVVENELDRDWPP